MPVLKKNTRPFTYPKGTRTASAIVKSQNPYIGIGEAEIAFIKEHGSLPPMEDRFYTIAFATGQTICEISDAQRMDD